MLGHLRFHRRGHSNPSSPAPDQLGPFDPGDALSPDPERAPHRKTSKQSLNDAASPPAPSPSSGLESGFMGGVALQNYRRAFGSARLEASDPPAESSSFAKSGQRAPRAKPVPPPIDTNVALARSPPVPVSDGMPSISSVSAPPSVPQQPGAQNPAGATGKRPPGAKATSEPPTLARSQTAAETQRGKKGLPFLKNPMSGLLMRRKASQNAPDLRPLPLPQNPTESTYDPRIRGTRVHDFSAPRQRVVPTRKPTVPGAEVWTGWDKYRSGPQSHPSDLPLRAEPSKSSLAAASDAMQLAASDSDDPKWSIDNASVSASDGSVAPAQISAQSDQQAPRKETRVPTNPSVSSSMTRLASSSMSTNSRPISAASSMQKRNMSTRTNRSHRTSLSEDTTLSALPKHMKSTSSRFSFDMIGAARAEKLLEERHRQRELERKANGEPPARDSRYDDFDEDAFDYDAAMDDGGFEEAIPGVNADFEDEYYEEDIPMVGEDVIMNEDEDDPDNDQENFAGFVFSRSDPHSSLMTPVTPGMVATPRDSTGRPIGHAITTDGTPDLLSAPSPLSAETLLTEARDEEPHLAGLGILGTGVVAAKNNYDPTVFQERRNMPIDDSAASHRTQDKGMYYDAGLWEELQMEADEIQRSDFDESIFDDVDTDQFGRPIPGAFAQNKALREKELNKRDSGMPSHSEPSSPTVASPTKADAQSVAAEDSIAEESKTLSPVPQTPPNELSLEPTAAAYQKALADAAHKAAATGWKSRWDDEPESPEQVKEPDVTVTSPTTDSQPSTAGIEDENTFQAGYDEDDGFQGGFDDAYDDDLLDDDFIAEANAEALAYDSDGFYGDEFGFYSAPVTRNASHGSSAPSSSSSIGESQYGGYFGPSGAIGRSASGRVLREPNLTPITERSEYSNRNSMMSMVMPSATLSDLRNSMASPAFAHMAPGIDDSETFSLSGLQRLRGKTFGGSQVSLNSSREGSPRSERAPLYDRLDAASPSAPWETMRSQSHLGNGSGGPLPHERKNSTYSLWSNSDAASGTGSPTLTVASMALSNNSAPPPPLFSPPPPPLPQPSPSLQCPPVLEDEAEEISSPDGLLQNASTDDNLEVADPNAAATTLVNASPTFAGDSSLVSAKTIHADPIGENASVDVDGTAHASPNNTTILQASEEGLPLPDSKTPILSRPLSLAFASPTVTHIASTLGFGLATEATPVFPSTINQADGVNNTSPNYYSSRFSTPPMATAPFTSRFSSKAPTSAYQVAVPPISPSLVESPPESPAFPQQQQQQQQYHHIHSRDNNRVSTPSLSTATRFSVSSLED